MEGRRVDVEGSVKTIYARRMQTANRFKEQC